MAGAKSTSTNLLLVEGVNDREFVYHLTNRIGIPRGAYVIHKWDDNKGGFDTVAGSLPGFLAGSSVQRLGSVVDADDVPADHWRSVVSRLRPYGYHLPLEPVKPTYKMKAQLHTWLAWQDEPGTPLGLAIRRGYFQGDAPLANEFVRWLRRLFLL